FGLDAVVVVERASRFRTALQWIAFGIAAGLAACLTPYGPQSILMTGKVLSLGPALSLIGEWQPADFSQIGGLEVALLLGFGLSVWGGVKLPPVRILILAGLIHMAL